MAVWRILDDSLALAPWPWCVALEACCSCLWGSDASSDLRLAVMPGRLALPRALLTPDCSISLNVEDVDACPETGRARLSYRRAEELFLAATRAEPARPAQGRARAPR